MKDKGKLSIEPDYNNKPGVIFQPVNSTVWLRKAELPELFGVSIQKVNACLDAVLKENIIDVEESCKYELYVNRKHIRYDIREINLEVIIAMAFRMDSPNAKILREWFIRRCVYPGTNIPAPLSGTADFCLN